MIVGVTAIVGFHFNWWEGRKFLEIPRPLDYLVVVNVLAVRRQHRHDDLEGAEASTTTAIVLFFGLLMAARCSTCRE